MRFEISLDYHYFHSGSRLFSRHKTTTMHDQVIKAAWRETGNAAGSSQSVGRSAPCDQPCDSFVGEEGEYGFVFQWIYDSSLKWLCVGCRYLITKLTISHQSRRDTESGDIFFYLKLLIFYGANWLQTWRWFATKIPHMSTSKMTDVGFILDRAVWGKYSLSFINNNMVWKQVIYWQLYMFF